MKAGSFYDLVTLGGLASFNVALKQHTCDAMMCSCSNEKFLAKFYSQKSMVVSFDLLLTESCHYDRRTDGQGEDETDGTGREETPWSLDAAPHLVTHKVHTSGNTTLHQRPFYPL